MTKRATTQPLLSWQRASFQELLARDEAGRLPHALILTGTPGIGKRQFAQALIESLLCQAPQEGMACGACSACHWVVATSHPDLKLVEPEQGSKQLKVDQVRELIGFFVKTGQFGRRIGLLAPADTLNRSAQNALLKTLEEPGANALLLLLTDQPSRLLPTVRSRCQVLALPTPPAAEALDWLTPRVGKPELAQALLLAAAGGPLRALELFQAEWFLERATVIKAVLAVASGQQPASIAAERQRHLLVPPLFAALADWSVNAASGRAIADTTLQQPLADLQGRLGSKRLLWWAREVQQAHQLLLSTANPNAQQLFERLLLLAAGVDVAASGF